MNADGQGLAAPLDLVTSGDPFFNNREAALLIWFGAILIFLVWNQRTRRSLLAVVQSLAQRKILFILAAMVGWISLVCLVGQELQVWRIGLIADTVIWSATAGFVLLFSVEQAAQGRSFVFRIVLATAEVTVLLAFFVNLVVFSLIVELFLQPLLFVLVAMSVVAATDRALAAAKRVLDGLVFLIVLAMSVFVLVRLSLAWDELDLTETVLSLILPMWLTIATLPFIYLVGLYAAYEVAFIRIAGWSRTDSLPWWKKVALLRGFHVHLSDTSALSGHWIGEIADTDDFTAIRQAIVNYRQARAAGQRSDHVAAEELRRLAGVSGTDDEGRRLDRREFSETQQALLALASAQMGWYRSRGERYQGHLLDILSSQFTRLGLPEEHGIELVVSEDGRSWWAWRRTVSGWCFGIGSIEPPPDQWLFEGTDRPTAGPDSGHHGWSRFGIEALEW